MTIDWRLALTPDDIGTSVAQSFQTGRAMARQNALEGAYKAFAADPVAGAKAVTAIDPVQGLQLQTAANAQADRASRSSAASAWATGDTQGAMKALAPTGDLASMTALQDQIRQMSEAQRKVEAEHADVLAGIGHGLLTKPYEERKSIIAHLAPALAARGFKPEEIAGFDPTDENITALQNSAMTLKDVLAREDAANKPVAFPEGSQVYRTGDLTGQPPAPASAGATVVGAPAPAAAPVQATPQDADALARMIMTEAAGEGAQGMAAAGAVALNRLRQGYGGAKTLVDVVSAPHQFEGMTSGRAGVSTNDPAYQHALQIAQGLISGQIADPTNGAVNFLNPELQTSLGRAVPGWATGQGLRIGKHVFFGGGQGEASPVPTAAPAGDQPYEVASNGPTPPPPSSALSPASTTPAPVSNPTAAAFAPKPILSVPRKAPAAPSGYRYKSDGSSLEPIPGGPADNGGDGADSGLTGDAFLKTLPPARAALIRAVAEGKADPRQITSFKAGERQQLVTQVAQYDPSFDLTNYGARANHIKDFSSTKPGTTGGNIVSAGTAINHLGSLDTSVSRLQNMGWRDGNTIANFIKTKAGDPSLTPFLVDRQAVADELTRAFRGSGGSLSEVQDWQAKFDAAASPDQLHTAIKTAVGLLESRLGPIASKHNETMGTNLDSAELLDPKAMVTYSRLRGDSTEDTAKLAFYRSFRQRWAGAHKQGDPTPSADAAWQTYSAKKFGSGAAASAAGPRERVYNPQTGRLD